MLGNTPNKNGFKYLQYAVSLYYSNLPYILSQKALYKEIALKFCVTPSSIEKSIRISITSSWHNRNVELADKIFGNSVVKNDIPTNSIYIAAIAEFLSCVNP